MLKMIIPVWLKQTIIKKETIRVEENVIKLENIVVKLISKMEAMTCEWTWKVLNQ